MDNYEYIAIKIDALKTQYPSLRAKPDEYAFSVLCVKANFYKDPAHVFDESEFAKIVVDSPNDGGADILLSDPNSEECDLVIGQSKFCKNISSEQVLNAVLKMANFYKDMRDGQYERVNERVRRRFLTLNAEVGEESKIHFVFYTSAPLKKSIKTDDINKKFREQFIDTDNIELFMLFGKDMVEEIQEAESRRPTIERGKVRIDAADNYLLYGDDAAIVKS